MSDRLDDARLASDERMAELEASLAAAEAERDDIRQTLEEYLRKHQDAHRLLAAVERRAEEAKRETDHWQKVAANQVAPLAHRATEAERRLEIAREALERIASGWGGPLDTGMRLARETLAALDGEGER